MSGFQVLLRHEIRGMVRTWRAPVIVAVALVLAVSGPILTKFLPDIITSVGGLQIIEPDPTWSDAGLQWSKDLTQIVTPLVILVLAHSVCQPLSSGTAALVLARPVSRCPILVAPTVAVIIVTAAVGLLGALGSGLVTALMFDDAPMSIPIGVTLRWLVLVIVLAAAAVFGAGLTGTMAGSTGFGLGLYFLLAVLTAVSVDYSPAGLFLLEGGAAWWRATATGLVLAPLLLVAGFGRFSRLPIASSPRT